MKDEEKQSYEEECDELYEEVSQAALWVIYITGALIVILGVYWMVTGGRV